MIHAPKIRKEFHKIRHEFKNEMTYSEVMELFKPVLKKFRAIPLLLLHNIKKDDFTIGGSYDYWKTRIPITIEFGFSAHSDRIKLCNKMIDVLFFNVYEILQHEWIHLMQYSWRTDENTGIISVDSNDKMNDNQLYHARKDEIGSYSHDIALEIFYQYPKENPFLILQNISEYGIVSYGMYEKAFNGSDWSTIKKKLLKLTYRWINDIITNKWQY